MGAKIHHLVPEGFYTKKWWEEFRRQEVEEILSSCDNPFANFDGSSEFGIDPLLGLSLRMQDKFQRIKSFCRDGELAVNEKGDTVRDIYRDLIGYSLIALGMLERRK
jgi:hypothetical protein